MKLINILIMPFLLNASCCRAMNLDLVLNSSNDSSFSLGDGWQLQKNQVFSQAKKAANLIAIYKDKIELYKYEEEQKKYLCNFCSATCSRRAVAQKHAKIYHDEQFAQNATHQCTCGIRFLNFQAASKHAGTMKRKGNADHKIFAD